MRRITSLFLTAALVLVAFAPSAVSASETKQLEEARENFLTASDNALDSVRGVQADKQLTSALAAYNVTVKDDTLLEVLPAGDGKGGTILSITNASGSEGEKVLLMAVNEDGNIQAPSLSKVKSAAETRTNTGDSDSVYPFNDSMVLTFLINYNGYSSGTVANTFVQPQTAMFIYYKNSSNITLTHIHMDYGAFGTEYTYPGLQPVGSAIDYVTHHVIVDIANNLKPRTYYSANNPYRPDRVIRVESTEIGGQYVDWTIYWGSETSAEQRYGTVYF